MAKYTWDHIHLRTANPEATAQWYERMLGAEVSVKRPRADSATIPTVASAEGLRSASKPGGRSTIK